jgi:hypothetical protein
MRTVAISARDEHTVRRDADPGTLQFQAGGAGKPPYDSQSGVGVSPRLDFAARDPSDEFAEVLSSSSGF